jgi:hypothetical protein
MRRALGPTCAGRSDLSIPSDREETAPSPSEPPDRPHPLAGVNRWQDMSKRHHWAVALAALAATLASQAARADEPTDRDREVALALEAAPDALAAKAGVYVHDKSGYVKARDSQNGFVCLVDHRIPGAVEPQCLDAEGVKTFLPKYLLVATLRAKGTPEPEIQQMVKAAFASGKLRAPARPGVIYMLSPHNVVTIDEVKGIAAPFQPHLMFYAPNMTSSDVGSDGAPTAPVFVVDERTPHALMIVPVPVGGAPGHTHPAH